MHRRILEIISGVIITLFLLGRYGDGHHPAKPLIEYITTIGLLQIIIVTGLVIVASRLIAGKPKDYSKSFFNLFVRLFGLPKKEDKG